MAAKTWATDFRYPAIQASLRGLSDAGRDDPFLHPGSFCLPVWKRPNVGWTLNRFSLLVSVLGFALLIACSLLCVLGARILNPVAQCVLIICCYLVALGTISSFFVFYDRIIRWLIGERADAILRRSQLTQATCAEVFDGAKSRLAILLSTGEGALLHFDEHNRRVMIEGLDARYQIRAADVEDISPFEWKYLFGARITYLIDSETRFELVIARNSILAPYLPPYLLVVMPRLLSNKVFENSLRTLRPAAVSEGDAASSMASDDAGSRLPR